MSKVSPQIDNLFSEFDSIQEQVFEDLFTFLRFKSVSSIPSYAEEVHRCADWLAEYLRAGGLKVELWETSGYPVVFASWEGAGEKAPTALFYGHYDVQPESPEKFWKSPPFEPTLRDGVIYARGALDNKGQIFYVIAAIIHKLKSAEKLPVNVKFVIEGEEETQSKGIFEILPKKQKELSANHLLVVDVGYAAPDRPSVTIGVRGFLSMEFTLRSADTDLHSGTHGGIVYNPNRAMAELLGGLYNKDGAVTIPGFYEDIQALTKEECEYIDFELPEDFYQKTFGAKSTGGEKGFTPLESAWIRPTLEINGLAGGYAEEGFKGIIPAEAVAKISCRLVPNQKPEKVAKLVEDYIRANVPDGVKIEFTQLGSGLGARTTPEAVVVQAAAKTYKEIFLKPCKFIMQGGSIPITAPLQEVAGSDMVLMGFGLPTDNIHAPNEHFSIDRFRMGFVAILRILERLKC